MTKRSQELQSFLDTLQAAILARASNCEPASRATERIFAALSKPSAETPVGSTRLPVCDHLVPALEAIIAGPAAASQHAAALAALAPQLAWHRRPRADEVGQPFASGHANATVIGSGGLEERSDVRIGISLMAPKIVYPDHHHPPEEVYLVLSPGAWRQNDGAWHEPGLGGIVYNPPGILHSMRSGPAPLLATWCLWVGDL